jgi:cytochrome c oxidase subunit III
MSVLARLREKPWLAQPAGMDPALQRAQRRWPERTALLFMLAISTVLFFLFTITFLGRTQLPDFQPLAGMPWQPLTHPVTLWVNTFWLLLSGVAMQLALRQSRRLRRKVSPWLVLATVFSGLFLAGQWLVWQQLLQQGYALRTNPANSYFYLFTAVHAVHVLAGIVALVRVWWQRRHSPLQFSRSLQLCSTYWHFLFVVWLALFALLTRSAETYNTLAAMCGF